MTFDLATGLQFTGLSFGGAAIWQYEGARARAINRLKMRYSGFFDSNGRKAGEFREIVGLELHTCVS